MKTVEVEGSMWPYLVVLGARSRGKVKAALHGLGADVAGTALLVEARVDRQREGERLQAGGLG